MHLNGNRAKPGRAINIDDELRIQRGEEEYLITIVELSIRRGPATVARTLYEESDENRIKRETLAEERKLEHQQHARRERRPDKRQRRRIVSFKSGFDQ